jgi:hypothetical protein
MKSLENLISMINKRGQMTSFYYYHVDKILLDDIIGSCKGEMIYGYARCGQSDG